MDDEEKILPKFLCDGYAHMPPSSGFDIITEHLTGLVMEINSLREEIKSHEILNFMVVYISPKSFFFQVLSDQNSNSSRILKILLSKIICMHGSL